MVDIPNEFIQTHVQHKKYMDIIKIRGVLVDILLGIAPFIHESYVTTYHKGVKQLVVQCHYSIYGTIMTSLLHYQKFRKSLELEVCELNPYDPCVTKNIIKNKQTEIFFHVEYCKIIHKCPKTDKRNASEPKQDSKIPWHECGLHS